MNLFLLPNPFELRGPEFLALFIIMIFFAAIACTVLWRKIGYLRDDVALPRLQLDPYEAAYLAGDVELAVDTAVATLVQRGVLSVDAVKRSIAVKTTLPPSAHPFERAVYGNTSRAGSSIASIRSKSKREFQPMLARLRAHGLVPSEEQARRASLVPALIMMLVTFFGMIKVVVGTWRGRPTDFLLILCFISGGIAVLFYRKRPATTSRATWFLDQLRRDNAALEYTAKTKPAALAGADLAMAIGLFGIGSLEIADGPLRDLRTTLQPPPSSSGGSSCSSSSCSSGSSCGGGCGGGCGGCGS